jgi:hypothetical protein
MSEGSTSLCESDFQASADRSTVSSTDVPDRLHREASRIRETPNLIERERVETLGSADDKARVSPGM